MIPDIFLVFISVVLQFFASIFGALTSLFSLPTTQIQNALVFFFGQLYYFRGVIDVPATLTFFGWIMALASFALVIFVIEWVWMKLPFTGN
jgi:hypothetical protein